MKKTALGIAVALALTLAGSVALAQPGRGGYGDGWQQSQEAQRNSHSKARSTRHNDRRDSNRGHQASNARGNGTYHQGNHGPAPAPVHVTPVPVPAPVHVHVTPVPVPARPVVVVRNQGNRPAPVIPAAVRAELRTHAQRIAYLNRIMELAQNIGDGEATSLVRLLITRENIRHRNQMVSLTNGRFLGAR